MIQTNFLAVMVAGIAATVVGFLWYGPLFGKPWSKMMGFTPEKMDEAKKKGMGKAYAVNFIGALVMAYVLDRSIAERFITSAGAAVTLAFWIWIGFIAFVMYGAVVWEGRPVKLFLINSLYYLVSLSVMGIILAFWR